MTISSISSNLTTIIRTLIETTISMWQFLTTPIFTIDLTTLPDWIFRIFTPLMPDFIFNQVHEISLIFALSSAGILIFIILKLITLLNPIG